MDHLNHLKNPNLLLVVTNYLENLYDGSDSESGSGWI